MSHQHPISDQVAIGQPLPFPVYDRDGHLLLRSGFVIESERQFELLSENGLFRDGAKGRIPLVAVTPLRTRPPAEAQEASRGARHDLTFEALDLAMGARLQVQRVGNDERRYQSTLIGCIPKVSVIIRTPTSDGGIVLFREGESVIVRAFSGTAAFAFNAIVLGVRYAPETYLHLAYPKHVEGASVRQQKRVDVTLIATATRLSKDGAEEGEGVASKVLDLSVGGAQLQSREPLGAPGEMLSIGFRLPTAEGDATLALQAEIRSSSPDGEGRHCHGVRFTSLEPLQALALRGYVAKPHR